MYPIVNPLLEKNDDCLISTCLKPRFVLYLYLMFLPLKASKLFRQVFSVCSNVWLVCAHVKSYINHVSCKCSTWIWIGKQDSCGYKFDIGSRTQWKPGVIELDWVNDFEHITYTTSSWCNISRWPGGMSLIEVLQYFNCSSDYEQMS